MRYLPEDHVPVVWQGGHFSGKPGKPGKIREFGIFLFLSGKTWNNQGISLSQSGKFRNCFQLNETYTNLHNLTFQSFSGSVHTYFSSKKQTEFLA